MTLAVSFGKSTGLFWLIMHQICKICSPNLTALASQDWQGAVNVEIGPPGSPDARKAQNYVHGVDSEQNTETTTIPDTPSENVPILPPSIMSGAMQTAYACMMAGAYIVVLPLGAIATHIGPPGRGQEYTHICLQLTGLTMIVIGFGLGCYLAIQAGIVRSHF